MFPFFFSCFLLYLTNYLYFINFCILFYHIFIVSFSVVVDGIVIGVTDFSFISTFGLFLVLLLFQ